MCDAAGDKRPDFGIRTTYRVFVSPETILCIFYTDVLVLSNPPIGPDSNSQHYMHILLTTDPKSGRVRIELSEERPAKTAKDNGHQRVSQSKRVYVRAHWRRLPAKP